MANGKSEVPSSYSKFTEKDLRKLGLRIRVKNVFSNIQAVAPSPLLVAYLDIDSTLMLGTEKAKSEFMVAPIIREIAQNNKGKIGVYPGYTFDVDKEKGLVGRCDYIFSEESGLSEIKDPVFFIVEAKDDTLATGVAQCAATMYAAKLFNDAAGQKTQVVFGAITDGERWRFYKMEENGEIAQEKETFFVSDLGKLLGVLQFIVEQA